MPSCWTRLLNRLRADSKASFSLTMTSVTGGDHRLLAPGDFAPYRNDGRGHCITSFTCWECVIRWTMACAEGVSASRRLRPSAWTWPHSLGRQTRNWWRHDERRGAPPPTPGPRWGCRRQNLPVDGISLDGQRSPLDSV